MVKSKSKDKKRASEEVKGDSNPQIEQVNKIKSKAPIKLHGVDNVQTFEHPASFSSVTKELDPSSLKHFIKNVDI